MALLLRRVERAAHLEGGDDRHCVGRDLLKLADVVHVGFEFLGRREERAAVRSLTDERLRVALTSEDFGLTQVIAGAPQLVHRWERAGTLRSGR